MKNVKLKAIIAVKMAKKLLIALILCLFAISTAHGDELKGGHIGCLTEEAFEEVMRAAGRNDGRGYQYYFDKGFCVFTKAGLPVSILDVGIFKGRAKVRVYAGGQSFVMWTPIENIVRTQ